MAAVDIGKLIWEMRKACGMSQMRLADKLGISYQQVQKYEKGASKLSVARLTQIADVFGVPVMAFLEGGNGSAEKAAASNLTEEEGVLLMLFRRLGRKALKESFLAMLRDMVRLKEKNG